MRKVKICKKLSKLNHIECSDHDCNCLEGKEFVAVDDLKKWINEMQCGGSMMIAKSPKLIAQKKGEMMMLRKIKDILNSQSNDLEKKGK